jgi:hypothetical protein
MVNFIKEGLPEESDDIFLSVEENWRKVVLLTPVC